MRERCGWSEIDIAPLAVGWSLCGLRCVKLCYVKLGALGVLGTKYLVQYSTVQYSTWYQVLGTKCFALSPGRHHGLPSPAILINNVDFEYCVPSTTLGTVPSAWHEIHGTKYLRACRAWCTVCP